MSENLSEAIRAVIRASGYSVGVIACFSTVDKGIISRFLRSERSMSVDTAERILTALGCTVDIQGQRPGAPLIMVKRHRRRKSRRREE
jgi:transcriptional regulator with XRE-family HTH domain